MISKLDLYRVFRQVGKSNSFSKAAEELYMTQPAVSQAIMQLERELSTRLFNRTPKGVTLTNEGVHLYEYINSAISLVEAGEEKILEFQNLRVGKLKIGVGDTISKYYLIPYLEEFHKRYPNIKFKIINSTTLELCALIKSGEIDIAICNLPIVDQSLEIRECIEIQDIFVCGEKYKELLEKKVSLEDLVKLPLIFLEQTSNSRKYVESYMLTKGIKIQPEIEIGSYDLLLEFAKINLGIACVVKEFAKEPLSKEAIYEIKTMEEIPKRSIGLCYLKKVPLSLASAKFLEIMEEGAITK